MNLEVVGALDEIGYSNVMKSHNLLLLLTSIEGLFGNITDNFKDLQHGLLMAMHDMTMGPKRDSDTMMQIMNQLNRKILNTLASIRAFQDFSEAQIKGEADTGLWHKCSAAFSSEYDNNKYYRIGYRLRNYIQHYGLASDSIGFETSMCDVKSKKAISSVGLTLNRDGLSTGFDWGKKVLEDIKSLPEVIDVIDLVSRYFKAIKDVRGRMRTAMSTEIEAALNTMESQLSQANSNTINYIQGNQSIGDTLPFHAEVDKLAVRKALIDRYKWHQNANTFTFDPSGCWYSLAPTSEKIADRLRVAGMNTHAEPASD